MIGEKEVIEHLSKGQVFDGIFLIVGSNKDFNPKEQNFIKNDEYLLPGEVYNAKYVGLAKIVTGKRRPKVDTLPYLKGQKVHLIHFNGSDSLFASWYSVIFDSKPNFLIALDSEGEIYVS